ncbi:hypothetical protein [Streptomyces goshikiensis]|uniref:hypothetical protein n=1 Tax=Streptomyces goshikiensis TaxID=1942 RepID=UPI0036B97231
MCETGLLPLYGHAGAPASEGAQHVVRLCGPAATEIVNGACYERSEASPRPRSCSVSALEARPFAAAMTDRHVLGVMPVERGSPLFTVVDVAATRNWKVTLYTRPSADSARTGPHSTGAHHTDGSCGTTTASCW